MVDLSLLGIATAFAAGTISFLSPCVLPLVPAYVSYVGGRSATNLENGRRIEDRFAAAGLSLCFVLGFSSVFVILGASATALGQLLLKYRYELNLVAGALVMLFGLFMLGIVKLPWLQRDVRSHWTGRHGRPAAAYALGVAFGVERTCNRLCRPARFDPLWSKLPDGTDCCQAATDEVCRTAKMRATFMALALQWSGRTQVFDLSQGRVLTDGLAM